MNLYAEDKMMIYHLRNATIEIVKFVTIENTSPTVP